MIALHHHHQPIDFNRSRCVSLATLAAIALLAMNCTLHAQDPAQEPSTPDSTLIGNTEQEDSKAAALESIPLWKKHPDQHHVDDDFNVLGSAYGSPAALRTHKPMIIRFKSMDELIHYSRGKLDHTDAQIDKIVERIEPKIDFAKSDLVIAYQGTSGPPFGEFTHEFKDGKLRFWLHKPESRAQCLALSHRIELFRIPKGMEVEEKNTKREQDQ